MVSRAAQEALRRLRADVTDLGRRVRCLLPEATSVLVSADEEGAASFGAAVTTVDEDALAIQEACEAFLALHSPVAAELRHAVAVVRIVPEFARSAHLMANVCRAALRIDRRALPPDLTAQVRRMSEQADKLLGAALEAHETQVLVLAEAVADMDDHLDELHRQFVRRVIDARRSGEIDMDVAVQLAMVARFYERVGDHAVNVASIVRFEIEGEMSLVAAAESDVAGASGDR